MIDAMFATTLDCNGRALVLDRARVVGIVNVTPDSFSDGGAHADTASAVAHGVRLAEEGADMLDVGGESTRPGAADISVEEELARVIPVIEGLVAATRLPISVDTSKPEVMRAAVAAGAGMINDVYALRREGALDAAAELRVPVCLMHMLGEPRMMQDNPRYDDVVGEVHRFLTDRLFSCELAGIDKRRVLVDPGFGFGKTLEHNLALLRTTARFAELGAGVYAGLSRKSMSLPAASSRPTVPPVPWRRAWWPCSAAPSCCGCTTWPPWSMPWPSGIASRPAMWPHGQVPPPHAGRTTSRTPVPPGVSWPPFEPRRPVR